MYRIVYMYGHVIRVLIGCTAKKSSKRHTYMKERERERECWRERMRERERLRERERVTAICFV